MILRNCFSFRMYNRLFLTVIICVYWSGTFSIRCFAGTDRQCLLMPDMKTCGSNEQCQCAKYRFHCSTNNPACTKNEQVNRVKKWAYTIVSTSTCEKLTEPLAGQEDISCCSTDGCNRPTSGTCSWSKVRRWAVRYLK